MHVTYGTIRYDKVHKPMKSEYIYHALRLMLSQDIPKPQYFHVTSENYKPPLKRSENNTQAVKPQYCQEYLPPPIL